MQKKKKKSYSVDRFPLSFTEPLKGRNVKKIQLAKREKQLAIHKANQGVFDGDCPAEKLNSASGQWQFNQETTQSSSSLHNHVRLDAHKHSAGLGSPLASNLWVNNAKQLD